MSQTSRLLFTRVCRRFVHTTPIRRLDPKKVEEVRIPVPWGHIAGQWWRGGAGSEAVVMGLHGRRDNAVSWAPLGERLSQGTSLLALDLPGCGQSSRLPPGYSYCWSELTLALERVAGDSGLEAITLAGHGEGVHIACFYAALYPRRVKGLIGIDGVLDAARPGEEADSARSLIDRLVDPTPEEVYSNEKAALEVLVKESCGTLSVSTAQALLYRGSIHSPGSGISLRRDPRLLESTFDLLHADHIRQIASQITCKVAFIKASRSSTIDLCLSRVPDLLHIVKSSAKSYEFHIVDGGHYVHMEDPDAIVPLIEDFLQN